MRIKPLKASTFPHAIVVSQGKYLDNKAMAYFMAEQKYRHQQRLLAAGLPIHEPSNPMLDVVGLENFTHNLNLNEDLEPEFSDPEYILNSLATYDEANPPNSHTQEVHGAPHIEGNNPGAYGVTSQEMATEWIDGVDKSTNRSRVVPHPLYGFNFIEAVHTGRCGRCECCTQQKK